MFNYPLSLRFKVLALANQIYVSDSQDAEVCYVKQKAFKLKENVKVFTDSSMSGLLCEIQADSVIDYNVAYDLVSPDGVNFGEVRRKGRKSIFKANYEILKNGNLDMSVNEENPMAKVFDTLLGEIPILGFFTGYFFHPSYLVTTKEGNPVLRVKKQPSAIERRFTIDKVGEIDPEDEVRVLISLMMMLVREGGRG